MIFFTKEIWQLSNVHAAFFLSTAVFVPAEPPLSLTLIKNRLSAMGTPRRFVVFADWLEAKASFSSRKIVTTFQCCQISSR